MKYFVTVLVLLIATTTAASAAELPKEWRGLLWCGTSGPSALQRYPDLDEGVGLLVSEPRIADDFWACANRGGMRFWRNGRGYQLGRFDARENCKIKKIVLIRPKVYRIYSHCRTKDYEADDNFEVWQPKAGHLFQRSGS
jgi:hypothetical protein